MHALAVTSGTAALHCAMSALGLELGQEVIIPAYLWVSVTAAVVNHGAIPILGEIDRNFCLDPDDLEPENIKIDSGDRFGAHERGSWGCEKGATVRP